MNIDYWGRTSETLLMISISTLLAYLVGVPLGVILKVTGKNGLHPNKIVNATLGVFVNFFRSIPCLIITVILIPVTRAVVGTGTGVWYAMVIPLFISSFAFVARSVEQSLLDVDNGVIEAAKSLGASDFSIIFRVMLPEARSSLIVGLAITLVNVLGYTSFAYEIGAGGLMYQIASFYRSNSNPSVFLKSGEFWTLIVIVVALTTLIQEAGLLIAKKIDKRKKLK